MSALNTTNSDTSKLRTEAQTLATTSQVFSQVKWFVKEGACSALSIYDALVFGASTPLSALIQKICRSAAVLFFRDLNPPPVVTPWGVQRARRGLFTIEMGTPYHANRPLIQTLRDNAKKMGLGNGIGTAGIALDHDDVRTDSISLHENKILSCPSIFYYEPQMISNHLRQMDHPQKSELITLAQNPAYPVFLGTAALAHIKMNTNLFAPLVQAMAMFFAMCMIHWIANSFEINTKSQLFYLINGCISLWLSNLIEIFYHRQMTYIADAKAVEITQDRASAVATLKQLKKVTDQPSKGMLILGFLSFSSKVKSALSIPSLDSRIQKLDPQGAYSNSAIQPIPLVSEPGEAEKLKYQIEQHKIDLKPLLIAKQFFSKENIIILLKATIFLTYTLIKHLYIGFFTRVSFWILFVSLLYGVTLSFFPNKFEQARSYFTSGDCYIPAESNPNLVRQIRSIGQDMRVTKNIEIWQGKNFEAKGVASGPGSVMVVIPKNYNPSNEGHTAALRHEYAHILRGDTLTAGLLYTFIVFALNTALDQAGYFATSYLQKLIQGNGIYLMAQASQTLFMRYREATADANSVHFAPQGEQENQRRALLQFLQEATLKHKEILEDQEAPLAIQLLSHIRLSSEGNDRFDYTHPSLTERVKALDSLQLLPHTKKPAPVLENLK